MSQSKPQSDGQDNNTQVVVLLVLDGWGISTPGAGNAIHRAQTPVIDELVAKYPTAVLQAAGESVGLPWGEMGNSEVGHFAIGTGRLTYHNLLRINKAIWDGSFNKNKQILDVVSHVNDRHGALHLIGMVSTGGVHSYLDHLHALLDVAKEQNVKRVYLHCILDGRDTPHNSGYDFIKQLQHRLSEMKLGVIATIHGRYFAMDRDSHWDRTEKSHKAITKGESPFTFNDPLEAITHFYNQKKYDEEIPPSVIVDQAGNPHATLNENDGVIFFNFRPDRARQLATSFIKKSFASFKRERRPVNIKFATFTNFDSSVKVPIAFDQAPVQRPLAEVISKAGWSQLHIAETEKYAHVTYFFNGGKEVAHPKEDHVLIPSLRTPSYDEVPEMSVQEITKYVLKDIAEGGHRFIVINFANADMVAHTANLKATMQAVSIIDEQIGQLTKAVLAKKGTLFITADHGNAEALINTETGNLQKEHTVNPVPFIIIRKDYEGKTMGLPEAVNGELSLVTPVGLLSDVAPTILKICGLNKPKDMTSRSLL